MKIVNELKANSSIQTFIDEDEGLEWHKVGTKDYVVVTDEEVILGTATLFSTGKNGMVRYVDVDRRIEGAPGKSKAAARTTFKEFIEIYLGKIYWAA